jgi:hypothetical protein
MGFGVMERLIQQPMQLTGILRLRIGRFDKRTSPSQRNRNRNRAHDKGRKNISSK